MESVTKYSFAKFKGIFVKLSSKLLIAVVLTEKEGGNKPNFGLYRSATLRTSKNFVLVAHCAHAFRRIRYLVDLWNEKQCKFESLVAFLYMVGSIKSRNLSF